MATHAFIVTPAEQTAFTTAGINIDAAVLNFVLQMVNLSQQSQLGSAYQLVFLHSLPVTLLTSAVAVPVVPPGVTSAGIHTFVLTQDQESILSASGININQEVTTFIAQQAAYTKLLTTRTAYSTALLTELPSSAFTAVEPNFIIPS